MSLTERWRGSFPRCVPHSYFMHVWPLSAKLLGLPHHTIFKSGCPWQHLMATAWGQRDLEGTREWRRKKWRLNRELATEMIPSSWTLAGEVRHAAATRSADAGWCAAWLVPGPSPRQQLSPLVGYIFFNKPHSRAAILILCSIQCGIRRPAQRCTWTTMLEPSFQ